MRNSLIASLGGWLLLSGLWLASEPAAFRADTIIAVRAVMSQYTGVVAMACMSIVMMLALRPRWPEAWLGGLDKMYRLHKWLGIAALATGVIHWGWAQVPKWAVALGWLQRRPHVPRPLPDALVERLLKLLHGPAEHVGEWAIYAAIVLVGLALLKWFPYRRFFKTHRIMAVVYLALVFHAVILVNSAYWISPLGLLLIPLLAGGTWAAAVVLVRRVGAGRRARGTIAAIRSHPLVHCVELEIALPDWPGHRAGQFAFLTLSAAEGAHPYTIASAWNGTDRRLRFVIKELGDHTRGLGDTLRVGQEVTVEGPYGAFTFEDARHHQVWVGAGIGITPFIARMQQLAMRPGPRRQTIDLFHATAEQDEAALEELRQDAAAAGVRLHIHLTRRDGRLTGEHILRAQPQWQEASTWFCGPSAFGESLKRRLGAHHPFHQELFAMR